MMSSGSQRESVHRVPRGGSSAVPTARPPALPMAGASLAALPAPAAVPRRGHGFPTSNHILEALAFS